MTSQNINVDFENTEAVTCEECENEYFSHAVMIRRVSPILSPTGQEAIIPAQVFQCTKCGHVNKQFRPS